MRICKACRKLIQSSWANYCEDCRIKTSIKKPKPLKRNKDNEGKSYKEYIEADKKKISLKEYYNKKI